MGKYDDEALDGREAAAPADVATAAHAVAPAGAAPAVVAAASAAVPGPATVAPARRPEKHVALQTVERLSVYRRVLEELDRDGVEYIHSQQLADVVGVTPAQLRRDLASFGSFGNISRGYNVYQMSRTIGRILGTDGTQAVALFGVGDLGRALLSYRGFDERGFHIAVAFDVDPAKVGRVFAGRRCYPLDELEPVVRDHEVRMAILATRPEGLQALVDRIGAAGVRAILNFVPKLVKAPAGAFVEHTDITAKLELLSFLVGSSSAASVAPGAPPPQAGGA